MEVGLLIISCWVISFLASPSFGQRCSCKKELTTIGSQVSEVNKNGKSIQKSIEKLQRLHDKLTSKINTTLKQGAQTCCSYLQSELPEDCGSFALGDRKSGIYEIYPSKHLSQPVTVYCDFSSEGSWTVIQRRFDGSVDFNRTWAEYRQGFGDLNGEHWLGNEYILRITSSGSYQLRLRLTDWENETRTAYYRTFKITSESDGYRLDIRNRSGDAGDSMDDNNGERFQTKDFTYTNPCAAQISGGWWYTDCGWTNLNGLYRFQNMTAYYNGIRWCKWHGCYYSLKNATMMISKL